MERSETPELYYQERIDMLASENRRKQEVIEKQAFQLNHLDAANELLSDQLATALVELTRLRILLARQEEAA